MALLALCEAVPACAPSQRPASPAASAESPPPAADQGSSAPPRAAAGDTVASVHWPSRPPLELLRRSCSGSECGLIVVTQGSADTRGVELEWRVPEGPVTPLAPEPSDDALVLLPPPEQRRWAFGTEESEVVVSLTPIRSAEPALVLIEVVAGFEHIERLHTLLRCTSDGCARVWSRADAQGPHRTAVAIVSHGEQDALLYLDAFFEPSADEPDTLSVTPIAPGNGAATPPRTDLPVLILPLGQYADSVQAKAAQQDPCLAGSLALSDSSSNPPRGTVSLVKVGVDAAALSSQAQRVAACTGKSAKPLRRFLEPSGVEH